MSTQNEELWRTIFADGHPALRSFQTFHLKLPSPPRCKMCYAPFGGIGSWLMRIKGKSPSNRNPRFCSACDKFIRAFPGGAEVVMSMLFVDIRGSTALSEKMSPTDFSRSLNSFYSAATKILSDTDGFIIDLVGDEVVALFPPGFTGKDHSQKAVAAARALLAADVRDSAGRRMQLGIGVHTGVVFIGTVTGAQAGIEDVRAVGDNVNLTARLASKAQAGEALLTLELCQAAGVAVDPLEERVLELKGKTASVPVRVLKAEAAATQAA